MSATTSEAGTATGANFWALLYVTLAARPVMRRQGGGRIVNIRVPRTARRAGAMRSGGDGSALALLHFSGALRAELAQDGIVMTTAYGPKWDVWGRDGPQRVHRHDGHPAHRLPVVLSRHVPGVRFLATLLGENRPSAPTSLRPAPPSPATAPRFRFPARARTGARKRRPRAAGGSR